MNKIKSLSISLLITLLTIFSCSCNCIASDTTMYEPNEAKHDYTREEFLTDKTPAMQDYIAVAKKQIKNNWYPPASSFENMATIIVTLEKSGKLKRGETVVLSAFGGGLSSAACIIKW